MFTKLCVALQLSGLALVAAAAPLSAQAGCAVDSARALVEREFTYGLHRWQSTDTTTIAADVDHLLLASDIAEVLEVPPPTLRFVPWAATWSQSNTSEANELGAGVFALQVATDGRLKSLRWLKRSSAPQLQEAVEVAVRTLSEAGRLPASVPDRTGEPKFVFRVGPPLQIAPRTVVLFRRRVAALQLDKDAEVDTPGRLRYPKPMQARRQSGAVDLEYVVGPNGRTQVKDIVVLATTDDAFTRAAVEAVLATRFRPAMIQTCRASQVVRQRVSFRM